MDNYEKLGAFYLGREYDIATGEMATPPLLYDAKDLTTHAVIVGMTGSGKTGLGITLLEEAAIDGIPALIVDPKGDMGNLMLRFPQLAATDFARWIDLDEASRNGMQPAEFAAETAQRWKSGLAAWDEQPARVQRFVDAADVAIYTPGSDAGLPLAALKSLSPPATWAEDSHDERQSRVQATVASLLTLMDLDADPLRSREFILLAKIIDDAWQAGTALDLAGLIRAIQTPAFDRIGIMDLETIFPADDRRKLAITVNNLLGSPAFAGWLRGEPLNIQRLLYTPEGKPRLAILSIAHLSDRERMFFVTLLLNEVIAWMRRQPGTPSLRALLYMDEVFGYLPPVANPPSKTALLTLLKQARAYGLGVVLATQNPVDLDYKALSNAGTWFLGRLQTAQDQKRVLDGLEGASASSGAAFDRQQVEATLSGLPGRVFYMNNVHEDGPAVFHTRWALSYLRGPLTRAQITELMAPRKAELSQPDVALAPPAPVAARAELATSPPPVPTSVPQAYRAIDRSVPRSAGIIYRPSLWGVARLHFVDSKSDVDEWRIVSFVAEAPDDGRIDIWESAQAIAKDELYLDEQAASGATYDELPTPCLGKRPYTQWAKSLKDFVYRQERLQLQHCKSLKLYSRADETEGDFKARLQHTAREHRDTLIEKLRLDHADDARRLEERIRKAQQRLETEKQQASSAKMSALISFGTSLLGALFSRKKLSVTNVNRAGTGMRAASRAAEQQEDVQQAEENLEKLNEEMKQLDEALEREIAEETAQWDVETLLETCEPYDITPRKSDISAEPITLLWQPFRDDGDSPTKAWTLD